MTKKKKKAIWWGIGIFLGMSFLGAILDEYDKGGDEKQAAVSTYYFTADSLLVLSSEDTLTIDGGKLVLHSKDQCLTAYFELHFTEEMFVTQDGMEPTVSGTSSNTYRLAFSGDYLDNDSRVISWGKHYVCRSAYKGADKNVILEMLRRLEKKKMEAEFEAMTSYDTEKKMKYQAWVRCIAEKAVDLPDHIDKITLTVNVLDNKARRYEFIPSMGDTYNTLINFIFGETVYETK